MDEYVRSLPEDRRSAIAALRAVILRRLPKGYEETMNWGMIIQSGLRGKFEAAFRAAGKKLDMGVSCVRFKKLDDLSLDAIGDAIAATAMEDFVGSARAAQSKKKAGK